mgnify:FL=1
MKASPNTPSPSRPSLSRQSSASSKKMSTRLMFGEEHCYVIDAKAYGNCGRYLNVSTILAQWAWREGYGAELMHFLAPFVPNFTRPYLSILISWFSNCSTNVFSIRYSSFHFLLNTNRFAFLELELDCSVSH